MFFRAARSHVEHPVAFRLVDKLIVYIDGFNLYFGLMDSGMRNRLWLDLVALSRELADERHLVETRYYTARVRRPDDSRERQAVFLDALEARYPDQLTIVHGFVQYEPWQCGGCGKSIERRVEKRTDVNLAADMVADAYTDRFDTAILISGDADLIGAVETVRRRGKEVVVAFPPGRASDHLRDAADAAFVISKTKIRKSQLPPSVAGFGGLRLDQPPEWT